MSASEKIIVYMGSFNPVHNGHLIIIDQILEKHPRLHLFVRYNDGVDLTSWEIKKRWFNQINADRGNRIILHKLTTESMKGKQYNASIFSSFIYLFQDEIGAPIDEVWAGEDAAPLVAAAKADFPNVDFVLVERQRHINSTAIREDLEGHRDWLPPFVYRDLKTLKEARHA